MKHLIALPVALLLTACGPRKHYPPEQLFGPPEHVRLYCVMKEQMAGGDDPRISRGCMQFWAMTGRLP